MTLHQKLHPRRATYWKLRRILRRGAHHGGWRFTERPRNFAAAVSMMRARMAERRKVGR